MTNTQAEKQAKKRWGAKAYVRNGGSFSSPERRAEASQIVKDAREEMKQIDEEVTRRLNELDWYRDLKARKQAAYKRVRDHEGHSLRYRFEVGKQNGLFTTILGQGDTWEEAFEKADAAAARGL